MESLRSAAAILATIVEKPTIRIIRWKVSMCEDGGSRGLGETSSQEVERVGSKPTECRGVLSREKPADPQTTSSEATTEL